LDGYGEAIEADLHRVYRLDLVDFFRGHHSWRKLRALVRQLPGSSAFVESQMNDPELAAWIAAQPDTEPGGPRLTEWTPDVARLTDIYDRLGELVGAVIASAGGKPPKIRPADRPRTEVDRQRASARRQRHDGLVAEVKAAQARWEANRKDVSEG